TQNRLCGCGLAFRECPVWSELGGAFGDLSLQEIDEIVSFRESLGQGTVLRRSYLGRRTVDIPGLNRYIDRYKRLYSAVRDHTGARVLVDSSKSPTHGYLLQQMEGVDVKVVHLVRDPRAVAFSWSRKKIYDPSGEDPMYMTRLTPAASSKLWVRWNLAAELLLAGKTESYLRLRYEDFVARPKAAMARVLRLLHEEGKGLPFVNDHLVKLGVNHTLAGNPSRFLRGEVELRPDEKWRRAMPLRSKLAVLALTWPLFLRYGYPRRPGGADGGAARASESAGDIS
ncbi:MAG: sulfotransferase, partial [Thermoanaerobaculia bacterium]